MWSKLTYWKNPLLDSLRLVFQEDFKKLIYSLFSLFSSAFLTLFWSFTKLVLRRVLNELIYTLFVVYKLQLSLYYFAYSFLSLSYLFLLSLSSCLFLLSFSRPQECRLRPPSLPFFNFVWFPPFIFSSFRSQLVKIFLGSQFSSRYMLLFSLSLVSLHHRTSSYFLYSSCFFFL